MELSDLKNLRCAKETNFNKIIFKMHTYFMTVICDYSLVVPS